MFSVMGVFTRMFVCVCVCASVCSSLRVGFHECVRARDNTIFLVSDDYALKSLTFKIP